MRLVGWILGVLLASAIVAELETESPFLGITLTLFLAFVGFALGNSLTRRADK